jgi:predicted AAA+ superfamily ATPase
MKRFIESYFHKWKINPRRKPMILRGARQVGKTFLIDKFGQENFKYYLKVNPEKDSIVKSVFNSKNPQLIINELSAIYNVPVVEGETLLFIDEIQLLPEAIASLRYFYEEMPGLHVITAGSLLDHTLNELPYSMPVGRVEFAYMYPLNFNEFLMANKQDGLIAYMTDFSFKDTYSLAIHQKLTEYLRLYFFIGGMPEAVKVYLETKNLIEVGKVHSEILTSFKYDFAKYGTRKQQEHLNNCLEYSAKNIGKKVKYVNIDRNAHSSNLKDAMLKLELSRIIHLVRRTSSSKVPIDQYVDNNRFKPIFLDIGLVCSMSKIKLSDIGELVTNFEGVLAEQFVGQELIASFEHFEDGKLYYWSREAKNANAEIDFLVQVNNKIYPVEVKAGRTGTLKSLQLYLAEKNVNSGIRFNLDLPSVGDNLQTVINIKGKMKPFNYSLVSMPLYFSWGIKKLMNGFELNLEKNNTL